MPTPYQIALLFVRLFAGMNLVSGAFSLAGSLGTAALTLSNPEILQGIPDSLACYGILYLLGGIGLLIFARTIATFAAKT